MIDPLRRRASDTAGFTLIEVMVTVLVIGVLAGIAVPTFLSQRSKGQDASAKADARNVTSLMESCFTTRDDYAGCEQTPEVQAYEDVTVTIGTPSTQTYTVVAHSTSGNAFTIAHSATGDSRSCALPAGGAVDGGCASTGGGW